MLEKEDFLNSFIESLNKNFERRSKYFNSFNYEQFTELNSLVIEINKCLILELFRATITLTNHYLERLLKLALIYNESGIGQFSVKDWDEIFNEPCEKYDSKSLGNSIELCKKEGLINEDEKEFLFFKIKEFMRNGFSHADSSKILAGLPEKSTFFMVLYQHQKI